MQTDIFMFTCFKDISLPKMHIHLMKNHSKEKRIMSMQNSNIFSETFGMVHPSKRAQQSVSLSRITRINVIRSKKTVPLILQFLKFFCIPEKQELFQLISGFCEPPDVQNRINSTVQKHHTGRDSNQWSHDFTGVVDVGNRLQQEVRRATYKKESGDDG